MLSQIEAHLLVLCGDVLQDGLRPILAEPLLFALPPLQD